MGKQDVLQKFATKQYLKWMRAKRAEDNSVISDILC